MTFELHVLQNKSKGFRSSTFPTQQTLTFVPVLFHPDIALSYTVFNLHTELSFAPFIVYMYHCVSLSLCFMV